MVETKLFDLTGKVALMTGASKGMGKAMAHALAAHGATVVISARTQETLDETAAEINQAVGAERVHGVAANAGRKQELETLVEKTHQLAGPVDILVGNAGVNVHYGPISGGAGYDRERQRLDDVHRQRRRL